MGNFSSGIIGNYDVSLYDYFHLVHIDVIDDNGNDSILVYYHFYNLSGDNIWLDSCLNLVTDVLVLMDLNGLYGPNI